jgi:hypothetical protein
MIGFRGRTGTKTQLEMSQKKRDCHYGTESVISRFILTKRTPFNFTDSDQGGLAHTVSLNNTVQLQVDVHCSSTSREFAVVG